MDKLKLQIEQHIKNLNNLLIDKNCLIIIEKIVSEIINCLKKNKPLLVFGNGGSASDALHITGELVGRFFEERKPLNVVCLNSNVSVITAWANDYKYEEIFSRQIEAHGKEGGICFGISTSGNSKNVIEGMKMAKKIKMLTISLSGLNGGKLSKFCDYSINVPSTNTPRIQEMHLPIYHYICEKVEESFIN